MNFEFAIVGGGLAGTAMLCQFVEMLRQKARMGLLNPSGINIQIFEKQDSFGPGFPHCDKYVMPFHITNMCAKDMGIFFNNPNDFQGWVENNQDELQNRFPHLSTSFSSPDIIGDRCVHYPRAIMGQYLKTRFQEGTQKARKLGLRLELHPNSEVVDLREDAEKIHLSVKHLLSGKQVTYNADRVLLATGHWFENNDQENYFSSPWPAENLLRKIPKGEKIAVIGTSLSALETLLTLTSEGQFVRDDSADLVYVPPQNPRSFGLYSRRGLLPKVRGKMGGYKNKFLTYENVNRLSAGNKNGLTLEALFYLLNSELEAAYGHPVVWHEVLNPRGEPADLLQKYLNDAKNGDGPDGELVWQTVLHQTFPMIREIYLNLTLEDRKRFDSDYTTLFFTHAATQPAVNAEKLLALLKAGVVDVFKLGEDYQLLKNDATGCYEFIYYNYKSKLKRDAYRYVVNARGQEKSLETNPSALAKNLLGTGTIQIEEVQNAPPSARSFHQSASDPASGYQTYRTGSAWIDPPTHRIMRKGPDGTSTPSNRIYAVGAITRGQIIDASMAHGIAQSTAKIAEDLVDDLMQGIPR